MKLPARVFLVVWWLDDTGGLEEHVTELARALRRAGVDVVVFSEMPLAAGNRYGRRLREAGIDVVAPPSWSRWIGRAKKLPVGPLLRVARTILGGGAARHGGVLGARVVAAMEREMRRGGAPDVVHLHNIRLGQAWVLRWAAGKGLGRAYTEHATIGDWGGPMDDEASRVVVESGAALASISEVSRDSLRDYLRPAGIDIRITHHVVSGPETVPPRQEAPRELRLCGVGRLQAHKGFGVLLDAVGRLNRDGVALRVRVAGEGPLRRDLRAQARGLRIDGLVTFIGHLAREEIASLLRESDVAVIPSLTEGLPLVAVESMSWGLAVVASRVGGIPEIVQDGVTGLLVTPGDAEELAAALRRIYGDAALRRALGAAARRTWENSGFHEAAVLRSIAELYKGAAAAAGG